MKNMHIIATDKPSRLQLNLNTKKLILFDNIQSNNESVHLTTQHIYITSDEEIKEGDWVLNIEENTIFKPSDDEIYDVKNSEAKYYEYCKKIILTTDQDLIKDGVQSIDDKFLEWFVKNPNCEDIEVIKDIWGVNYYKIIIPKEEPKQETLEEAAKRNHNEQKLNTFTPYSFTDAFIDGAKWQAERMYSEEDMKQETIEDAFKKTYLGQRLFFDSNEGKSFEQGAKWQAKRMYSEEEVIQAFEDGMNNVNYDDFHVTTKQWFEQFKKK